jgi:hypothetical protein
MYTKQLKTFRFAACYWHRTIIMEVDAAEYTEALAVVMEFHPAAQRINRLTNIKGLNLSHKVLSY